MSQWRDLLATMMQESAQTGNNGATEFNYRWEHVQAVVKCAVRLAQLTGADEDIIEAAAWLHDILKGLGEKHAKEGATFARNYLPQTDFPPTKIELVARCIEEHSGLWRDVPLALLESQVLWDADKLTKIGATAMVHWIGYDVLRGKMKTTDEVIARLTSAEWRKRTVESMHTLPARRAAQTRLVAYDQLLAQLATEWDAADLTP